MRIYRLAFVSFKSGGFFLAGEIDCNKKAVLMVLSKVVEDPQSGNCPNISYADVAGPVANFNPTGSPYAMSQASFGSTTSLSSSGVYIINLCLSVFFLIVFFSVQ